MLLLLLQINELKSELSSAHEEIDQLLLQNNEYQQKIKDYEKILYVLEKITRLDAASDFTPKSKRYSLQPQKFSATLTPSTLDCRDYHLGIVLELSVEIWITLVIVLILLQCPTQTFQGLLNLIVA